MGISLPSTVAMLKGFVEVNGGITSHAWNADMSALAMSPNNQELHILHVEGGTLVEKHVNEGEHSQVITGIDWAPKSDMIVTCSQDRSANVWKKDANGNWAPSMVVLKSFGRAATSVKWAPCETRFAVGSGAQQLQVCYFQEESDWWLGKPIREGIESTIMDLSFHPSSLLVAAGGCDKKVVIYSSILKSLDNKAVAKELFGEVKAPRFGATTLTVDTKAWVNGISFSPSGNTLAAATHDSCVLLMSLNHASEDVLAATQLIKLSGLPVSKLRFLDETTFIGVGYDMVPLKFTGAGAWKCEGSIDVAKKKEESPKGAAAKWKDLDDRAGQKAHRHETTHENTITSVFVKPGSAEEFTTAGLDGRIAFWNINSLDGSFAKLALRKE